MIVRPRAQVRTLRNRDAFADRDCAQAIENCAIPDRTVGADGEIPRTLNQNRATDIRARVHLRTEHAQERASPAIAVVE